jgi:hypothetical protein
MELDDLKAEWQAVSERLTTIERALQVPSRVRPPLNGGRQDGGLRLVHATLWYEVTLGIVAMFLIGSYLGDQYATLRFALPAALLQLVAIGVFGVAAWQLATLHQLDYGAPILEVQQRIARLQRVRASANRLVLLASPLLWSLLVIVVPHALARFDVLAAFGGWWVAGNVALGVAVLGSVGWLHHRRPGWFVSSPLMRALGEDLTGRRVAAAAARQVALARFAQDDEGTPG